MNSLLNTIMEREPYDMVLYNLQFVNVCTGEIYPSEIGIRDGKIGHVCQPGDAPLTGRERYDAAGQFAIPGLIDTHVHIESTMLTPENMAAAVLPHGTTTIACDPHELANVLGTDGVRYVLEASRGLPLQIHVLVPSCVPSALHVETAGAEFTSREVDELLALEGTLGLGEVMDYPAVLAQDARMMQILSAAKRHTRFLQGHAPGLVGPALSAYLAAGIKSCHETTTAEEARYKLRAGMTLECREGSVARDIAAIAPVLRELGYPGTVTLCTDDREPDDLTREGHIDHAVRVAIANGIPPLEAVRMATCNAARLLEVEDVGILAPGRLANIVLLPDLEAFVPNEVFVRGRLTAKGGRLLTPIAAHPHPVREAHTIHLAGAPAAADFQIPCAKESALVHCMEYDAAYPLHTHLRTLRLPARNGLLDISEDSSLALLAVYERHGKNGNKALCVVRNLGLAYGAIASTVSHDCHNLVVVGKDPADMELAANALLECGGGFACAAHGKLLARLELPIAGLMSPLPAEELAPVAAHLKTTMRAMGLRHPSPLIQVSWFALAVIPEVRLTDMGLLDVASQQFLPLFADE